MRTNPNRAARTANTPSPRTAGARNIGPRSTAIRALATVVVGAALLVGCGDDGDSKADTTTTSEVDPQAAIDQVNGICARFNAEFDKLAEEETEVMSLAEKAVDFYDEAIDDFKAVDASGDTAETLDKMIESLEQSKKDMNDAIEEDDEDAIIAAGEAIDERTADLDDEVADAGFTECNDESSDDEATTTTEVSAEGELEHVDLTSLLTAPTGFGLQSVDDETVAALGEAFASDANLVADRYGTTLVFEGETAQGLLIFLGLKEAPDDTRRAAILESLAGTATDVETGTVAGSEGIKFTDSTGGLTFATVRDDSILMAIAQTEEALVAIVSGLFEQNPEL